MTLWLSVLGIVGLLLGVGAVLVLCSGAPETTWPHRKGTPAYLADPEDDAGTDIHHDPALLWMLLGCALVVAVAIGVRWLVGARI